MDDTDKKQFATIFYGLAEEYGGTITKNGVLLKFEALKEYPIQTIVQAVNWLVHNRGKTYPPIPTIEEIETAINKIEQPQNLAEIQCDIVLNYLNCHGRDCTHVFKNQTTKYLMENRWSFRILDEKSKKDPALDWFRKDFVRAFDEIENSNIAILPGRSERCKIPADNLKQLI